MGGVRFLKGGQGRTLKRRQMRKDPKEVREIITWISKGKVFQEGERHVQRP